MRSGWLAAGVIVFDSLSLLVQHWSVLASMYRYHADFQVVGAGFLLLLVGTMYRGKRKVKMGS